MSEFGSMTFCVNRGVPVVLKEGEDYYAQVNLPDSCFKAGAMLKTPKRPIASMDWNALQTLPLSAPVPVDAKVTLALYQSNRVRSDTKVGMTDISLEPLTNGENIDFEYSVCDKEGKETAKISLRINWEEFPANLTGTGVAHGGGGDGAGAGVPGAPFKPSAPLPPCKGQDFTVRVYFHKAKQLMSTKDDKEFSPKGVVTIGKQVEATDVIKRTQEPNWDQEVTFNFSNVGEEFWNETINVSVVDTKGLLSSTIGSFDFDCGNVYRAPKHFMRNKWVVLRKSMEEEMVMGFLKINICVLNLKKDAFPEFEEDDEEEESEESIIANLISSAGAAFEQIYLHCDLVKAMDIPQMDIGGTADPYVKMIFGKKTAQTANIRNTLTPEWNTQIQLPVLQPSLASALTIQMWDYDSSSADDIIGTEKLKWDALRACGMGHPVSRGLPALPATWINIYGHPRGEDSDFNKYYKAMAKGDKKGIDYRGRVLLRIVGSKSKHAPTQLPIEENELEVNISTEVMLVSSIPASGKYKVRVSCGLFSVTTKVVEATKMKGPDGQFCVFFGERLTFNAKFPVIVPQDEHHAPVEPQIPDVLYQLVKEDLIGFSISLPGKIKETMPFASTHFAAEKMMRNDEHLTTEQQNEPFYICKAMRLSIDPDKTKEGAYPANPICQLTCGVTMLSLKTPVQSFEGLEAPKPWTPSLSAEPMKKAILDVFVYQARDVPAGDDNGLSDPFIRVSWSNCVAQSCRRDETLNPTFNEMLRLEADVRPRYPDVTVELWDYDLIGKNTFLAKGIIPFEDVVSKPGEASPIKWVSKMTDSLGQKLEGTSVLLSFQCHLEPTQAPKLVPTKFALKVGEKPKEKGYEIPEPFRLKMKSYTLSGSILGLRNMRKFRLRDLKKPKVEAECAGFRVEIGGKTQTPGPNPDYKQQFQLHLLLPENPAFLPSLNLRVSDEGLVGRNYVGQVSIPLRDKKGKGINEILNPSWREQNLKAIEAKINDHAQRVDRKKQGLEEAATDSQRDEEEGAQLLAVQAPVKPPEVSDEARRKVSFKGAAKAVRAQNRMATLGAAATAAPSSEQVDVPLLDGGDEDGEEEELSMIHMDKQVDESGEPVAPPKPTTAMGVNDAIDAALGDALRLEAEREAKMAVKEERRENQQEVVDTDSDASSMAEEPLWFDRFDAEGSGMDVGWKQQVSRLGKLHIPDSEHRSLEQVFGPFDDDFSILELSRGWGKDAKKSGQLRANFKIVENLSGAKPTTKPQIDPTPIEGRRPIEFIARIYILSCSNLAALDDGPLGSFSDPYVVLKLGGGGKSKDGKVVRCKDEGQFQTLNPEFYFMKEMEGNLQKHSTLTIQVYDYDKIGRDEEIGSTDISLEDRWFSRRGYNAHPGARKGWGVGDGSYTETRQLVNSQGHSTGSIELWVDIFNKKNVPIPRPIDVTPPPPLELELRAIVWNTRDVELVDKSFGGEEMTDIYVRCFMDGMRHDVQNTDVHYRSLDGTGNFNWRMCFTMLFEPRTKTVQVVSEEKSKLASLFSVRKEKKKLKPILHVQIFDNDLLPGADDFIGEVTLDLLSVRPTLTHRRKETFLDILGGDAEACCTCNVWPCNKCCPGLKIDKHLTLQQKQARARQEMKEEIMHQERQWNSVVDEKIATLKEINPDMSLDEERKLRKKLKRAIKRANLVNVFEAYLPKRKKANAANGEQPSNGECPTSIETAKYWFACRGPMGGGRVGDVQMSFQLARTDAFEDDETLPAGKGRSDPHALPEPNRPDSSFFWLSSPWKSAVHILWKNYKWYFLTIICLALSALFLYEFFNTGLRVKTEKFFSS